MYVALFPITLGPSLSNNRFSFGKRRGVRFTFPYYYLKEARSFLLVVDDDPLNLMIIERMLQAEQYNVVTCISGYKHKSGPVSFLIR